MNSRTQKMIDGFFESRYSVRDLGTLLGKTDSEIWSLIANELTKLPAKFPFDDSCQCETCLVLKANETIPESIRTLAATTGQDLCQQFADTASSIPPELLIQFAETVRLYLSVKIKEMIERTQQMLNESSNANL